ncbi:polymerase [Weissella paramesenteroides]
MQIKNLEKLVIECLITVIFIYSYGGGFLIPNASITRGIIFSPGPLMFLILILTIFCYSYNTTQKKEQRYQLTFVIPVLFFCILNFLSFCYLLFYKNIYDRTIFSGLETALCSLVYIPLAVIVKKADNIKVGKIFNIVSFIAIVSITVQITYANFFHIIPLHSFDLNKLSTRNDGYRVQFFDPLVSIYILNSFNSLLKTLKSKFIIPVFIGLYYLILISQTRSILIFVLVALVVDYCVHFYNEIIKGKISVFSLATLVPMIGGLLYSLKKVLLQLYEPIQEGTYLDDGSYFARIGELTYYISEIKNNFLFGLGNFSVESPNSVWWSIIHGPTGYYYTQDIGILGDVARLGILIIPLYLSIILLMFKQQKQDTNQPFFGYMIILLGALGNYSLFNNGISLGLVLFFSSYYLCNWRNRHE